VEAEVKRRASLLLALLGASLPSTMAVAQPAPDAEAIAKARALNQKAENLFAIAEYDRAIAAFKEAYELAPTPGLLFNIAQAYRLKGPDSCKDAVRFYRNYLIAMPEGPNREQVDTHLAALEPCPEPAVELPHPIPPIVERPVEAPSRWPYVGVIAGGALAVTGGVMFFVADRRFRDLQNGECAARDCPASVWEGDRFLERAGVGLAIGGAAIAITSVVWLATRPSRAAEVKTAIAPWADTSGGGVAIGGRF
jgi:tetratricopeptide (TPR) repeat protein